MGALLKRLQDSKEWQTFETFCRERQAALVQLAISGDNTNQRMRHLDMAKGVDECLGIPKTYRQNLSDLCRLVYNKSLEDIEAAAAEATAESIKESAETSFNEEVKDA